MPVVRTDDRSVARAVYGHVITKFSRMGRFTELWGSARELRAPLWKDKDFNSISDRDRYLYKKRMQLFVYRSQILFVWFLYHDNKVPWINALLFNHACRLGRMHKLYHKNEIPVISLSDHSLGDLEYTLSIFFFSSYAPLPWGYFFTERCTLSLKIGRTEPETRTSTYASVQGNWNFHCIASLIT